jgi:hypothetical protein
MVAVGGGGWVVGEGGVEMNDRAIDSVFRVWIVHHSYFRFAIPRRRPPGTGKTMLAKGGHQIILLQPSCLA